MGLVPRLHFFAGALSMRVSNRAVMLVLGLLIASVAGCGQREANVGGRVTFQEKPVVFGTVTLMAEDGVPFQGQIQPDGTFLVERVPLGTYRVAVHSPDRNRPPPQTEEALPPERKEKERASGASGETGPAWVVSHS